MSIPLNETRVRVTFAWTGARRRFAERAPVKRVGDDRDLRAAVVFLAAPGSAFFTGQDLVVDGGWTVW